MYIGNEAIGRVSYLAPTFPGPGPSCVRRATEVKTPLDIYLQRYSRLSARYTVQRYQLLVCAWKGVWCWWGLGAERTRQMLIQPFTNNILRRALKVPLRIISGLVGNKGSESWLT